MKTSLKLAAVAVSAFGIAGGAALAQAEGTSYSSDPSVTPRAASPMPGFSTNGTPRGNAVNSVQSNGDAGSNATAPDSGSPSLQPRPDRN